MLRVKGWLQLSDYPGKPVLVQGVGRRLEITQGRSGVLPQAAVLVLLGLSGSLRDVTAPDGTPLEGSN
ncbi:MAG: GTP-binding protein [Caldilineaceae bacterium]